MFNNFIKFKNNLAIIDNKKKITYSNLLKNSKKIKHLFKDKNLILILCENSYEIISFYVYCIMNNQTVLMIDSNLDKKLLSSYIEEYSPNMVYCNKIHIDKFSDFTIYNSFKNYTLLKNSNLKKYKIDKELCMLLTTSGSTGSPQCVKITKKSLSYNTNQIINNLGIRSNHKTITTLPFFYTYGLSIINTHLQSGASIVINRDKIFQKTFWHKIKKYSITSFGGVAYMYYILRNIKLQNKSLKSIKYLTHAGGKLDLNLIHYMMKLSQKKNFKFYNMYGAVEAVSRISILDYKFLKSKSQSIGKGLKGTKVFLERINKKNIGEIAFKGKNIFSGYSHSYKDLNKLKNFKYHKTGDLGYKDKDGFIYILGRKDRFIKILSNRLNLDEIANILNKRFNSNCICIGKNNLIILFLDLRDKIKIINFFENVLKISNRYLKIISRTKIIYTASNKVSYNLLNKKFL